VQWSHKPWCLLQPVQCWALLVCWIPQGHPQEGRSRWCEQPERAGRQPAAAFQMEWEPHVGCRIASSIPVHAQLSNRCAHIAVGLSPDLLCLGSYAHRPLQIFAPSKTAVSFHFTASPVRKGDHHPWWLRLHCASRVLIGDLCALPCTLFPLPRAPAPTKALSTRRSNVTWKHAWWLQALAHIGCAFANWYLPRCIA